MRTCFIIGAGGLYIALSLILVIGATLFGKSLSA